MLVLIVLLVAGVIAFDAGLVILTAFGTTPFIVIYADHSVEKWASKYGYFVAILTVAAQIATTVYTVFYSISLIQCILNDTNVTCFDVKPIFSLIALVIVSYVYWNLAPLIWRSVATVDETKFSLSYRLNAVANEVAEAMVRSGASGKLVWQTPFDS